MAKLGDGLPVELRIVRTRPLFVVRLDVKGPLVIGVTSNGLRRPGGNSLHRPRSPPQHRRPKWQIGCELRLTTARTSSG
jgi:hypothetical protein